MEHKADYILVFRETLIPLALLKMSQVLREMGANEVLEIITCDPDVRTDVVKVIPGSTCELIDMEFNRDANTCLIRIKKKRHFRP